jgi:hypothetical protein
MVRTFDRRRAAADSKVASLSISNVRVVAGACVDHRGEHRHRLRVGGEPLVVHLEPLVDHLVLGQELAEAQQLLLGRKLAPDEQPRYLGEGGVGRDLLDRLAAIAEDPLLAVDVRDGALARRGAAEAGVGVT